MSFKFLRFRRQADNGAVHHAGQAEPVLLSPVESGRIKALARDRFDRADRMMQRLAANDEDDGPAILAPNALQA